MRLRSALAPCAATAALAPALVIGAATAAPAQNRVPAHDTCSAVALRQPAGENCEAGGRAGVSADRQPDCAVGRGGAGFPIRTRIQGGPADYAPGADYRTWSIEMTNTVTMACHDIHPVIDLIDSARTLKNRQIRLEFRDTAAHRWRPVSFTSTDEDEHVGPFGDGFAGFVIKAGKTVSVDVRLAFTRDTAANDITTSAAVVRRHGDDGDWVGESGGYRFSITGAPAAVTGGTNSAAPDVTGSAVPDGTSRTAPDGTHSAAPDVTGSAAPDRTSPTAPDGTAPGATAPGKESPGESARPDRPLPAWAMAGHAVQPPGGLATTGHHHLRALAAAAVTCLIVGASLVVGSRRPRIKRPR